MRDNPEGGELDPAEGVHRRCMKNSILSCIGKTTREGCNRSSEEIEGSGRRGSCGKDFVSKESSGCV